MQHAILYRMVTTKHLCPFGIKAYDLLKRKKYTIDDRHLTTDTEIEAFKKEHHVTTTPQIFIDDQHIGGYDDLLEHLNIKTIKQDKVSYQPIIAIFASTFLMALAMIWHNNEAISPLTLIPMFIAITMAVLAIQKLRDLDAFSNQFITYDLIAMRWVRYAYIYPFIELSAGMAMIAGIVPSIAAIAAFFIGFVGAISVFKAVYIDKRALKCACVGGNSNVPLGFVSLSENLMMIAIALWTLWT